MGWLCEYHTHPRNSLEFALRAKTNEIKLFQYGRRPVLRGAAAITSNRTAYLWTTGYTPQLDASPGREVPNPLTVEIVRSRGDVAIEQNPSGSDGAHETELQQCQLRGWFAGDASLC